MREAFERTFLRRMRAHGQPARDEALGVLRRQRRCRWKPRPPRRIPAGASQTLRVRVTRPHVPVRQPVQQEAAGPGEGERGFGLPSRDPRWPSSFVDPEVSVG